MPLKGIIVTKNETEGMCHEIFGVLHVDCLSSMLHLTLRMPQVQCWQATDEFSQGRCEAGKQVQHFPSFE